MAMTSSAGSSELVESTFETDLVRGPVEYSILFPSDRSAPLPMLYLLHGGDGDRTFLATMRPVFEAAWAAGELPPVAVVTPSAGRWLYMDLFDGSQRWETLLSGPFLDHLRREHALRTDRAGTLTCGISMGGLGSLNLAFKHSEVFSAVAAVEPAIMPALHLAEVSRRNEFFRGIRLLESIFGSPPDAAHWEANNPASQAFQRAEEIRASGLAIYLECGNEDSLHLDEGTEFLHRVLWEQRIPHEYHLVAGADHVGATLAPRLREALGFLGRVLNPPGDDAKVQELRRAMRQIKRLQGLPLGD